MGSDEVLRKEVERRLSSVMQEAAHYGTDTLKAAVTVAVEMVPKWKHYKPTTPGYYLRSNPSIPRYCRANVWELHGELWTNGNEGNMKLNRLHPSFWWYGPIPEPPQEPTDE